MKILILGGTGAMGIHLVDLLSEVSSNQITVTSRKSISKSLKSNVRYVEGNAKDQDFLNSLLMQKWDVIVDFMVYSTCEFRLRVMNILNSTGQYIYLSSSRVYGDINKRIKESAVRLLDSSTDKAYLATDEYALSKARQENILRDSGFSNWTIIRPYITFAENRLQLGVLEKEDWLYRALNGKTIVFSSDILKKKTTLTYGRDVSRGICSIVGNQKAFNRAFHITLHDSILWSDVLKLYLSILETYLGFRPNVKLLNLNDFMSVHQGYYQIVYDRLFDRSFDNSDISSFIDIDSFMDSMQGLESCLKSFLEKPSFDQINWASEGVKDKLTSEHTPLNKISGLKNKLKYIKYRYLN